MAHKVKKYSIIKTIKFNLKRLIPIEYPEINSIYIFGSYAKKTQKPSSDIDIAYLTQKKKKLTPAKILRLSSTLEKMLSKRVDLVSYENSSLVLQSQIRLNNIIVYDLSPKYRKEIEMKTRLEYFDFLPKLAYYNKIINKKLEKL